MEKITLLLLTDPSTGKISITYNKRVRSLDLTRRHYDFTVQRDMLNYISCSADFFADNFYEAIHTHIT
jgi:hypothetical protein